ncbi:anti-repressor SinI family protein [Aquibacillus kalidii]|nr:anti-repressor SinI family protein [Aquibacillus kalidii]
MTKLLHKSLLDDEWVTMLEEAKAIGLTIEEIRLFLQGNDNRKLAH